MILPIAIIYISSSDVMFDQQLKLLSENPQAPLKKSTPPFLVTPPKNLEITSRPHFLPKLKHFWTPSPQHCRKDGWEGTVCLINL